MALDLERIHRLYETVLPDAVSDPSQPVLAVVVEDGDGLVEWLPQYDAGQRSGGVFLSRRSGHYMVIRLDVGREIVYHEYLHLLTRLNVGKIPIWLNEGFAEFYSATEFVGSKARFGGINQDAISYLNRRSLIPFEELVGRVTNPHDDGNWIDIRVFYAQAWALTHHLMLGNEELASAGAVGRYMNLVQQGADQVEAFVEVVGPLDEVREDLRRYLRRLRLSVFEQELGDDLDDDGFVERDLPPHEMLAEQAVVLAGSGFVTEAADLVGEARAHDPESPAVLTARRAVDARSSLPATERAGGDSDERQVTMSGTWTELRCLDIPAVDFVIQSHRPLTTLVITAAGSAPIEIMGPSGEVQERVGCGSVGREVEVDFTIRRIAAGTVYGDMTELRFP